MGYVGLSVAFAFAIAALMAESWMRPGPVGPGLDHGGLDLPHRRHRAGILVAYYELGWGGWCSGPGGERLLHALAGRHALIHSLP